MSENWVTKTLAGTPAILTTEELVVLLRMSRRQVYRLLTSGRIHAVKQAEGGSSRHLIPRSSVEKYLLSLEVE
jgi:excisionase family DNA binding protein